MQFLKFNGLICMCIDNNSVYFTYFFTIILLISIVKNDVNVNNTTIWSFKKSPYDANLAYVFFFKYVAFFIKIKHKSPKKVL